VVGKEAMLVELYREGRISHGAFARVHRPREAQGDPRKMGLLPFFSIRSGRFLGVSQAISRRGIQQS
jgi:hypothetical protein